MNGSIVNGRLEINRRQLLAGAAAAGLVVAVGPRLTFAQDSSSTPAGGAALPEGEAAWTKFNLNAVTDDQILTIPGTGDRMVREFEEYRPYTSIEQFRQEIGKYVDEDVVSGYEAYVFVPVDPNEASEATLQQLPGVDADKASALVGARPYADDAAFLAALGQHVSAEQAALAPAFLVSTAAADATWVKYNLNTVTEEQILSIPATGDRMVHEFEEYRPYTSIEQFRQEIGKYVDADVVAGYETYVFVPVDPNEASEATLQQIPGLDADKAAALVAARPFADARAFLTALGSQVSAAQAALAAAYLATS